MANPTNTTGVVNVTSNDIVSRKITGNFNGTIYLYDFMSSTLLGTKTISNGIFSNVHYKIANDPSHFVVNLNGVGYDNSSTITTTSFENNTIIIDAPDDTNDNDVILVIDNTTPIGTYNITNSSSATTVKGVYVSNGTSLLAQSGSITITSKTANRIIGTFNFTTGGSNSFTQGTFDLEY